MANWSKTQRHKPRGGVRFRAQAGRIRKALAHTWGIVQSTRSSMSPGTMRPPLLRGPAKHCPRRPSGSMQRAGAWSRSFTRGAMNLFPEGSICAISGKATFRRGTPAKTATQEAARSTAFHPMATAFIPLLAMCGSGAQIGLELPFLISRLRTTLPGRPQGRRR
jgi:hypothetical protein